MEMALGAALQNEGYAVARAHRYNPALKHGFIASQREGIDVFRSIDPEAPLIVAEAVWQYSHHVLAGLTTHRGPILTVANWSGQWPGLVGMLNLNGSLTKAGVKYSTLWSADFTDTFFRPQLREWLKTGRIQHDTSHAQPLENLKLPAKSATLGKQLAEQLRQTAPRGRRHAGALDVSADTIRQTEDRQIDRQTNRYTDRQTIK